MKLRTSLNVKRLRDLRTQSGRVDRAHVPYMAYMKISCLEMEKARRATERQSAQRRIDSIDARVAELDAEKDALLVRLGERAADSSPRPCNAANNDEQSAGAPTNDGFKIRY
jgi:hypothetical protein